MNIQEKRKSDRSNKKDNERNEEKHGGEEK
jgi:hypothetical protein